MSNIAEKYEDPAEEYKILVQGSFFCLLCLLTNCLVILHSVLYWILWACIMCPNVLIICLHFFIYFFLFCPFSFVRSFICLLVLLLLCVNQYPSSWFSHM